MKIRLMVVQVRVGDRILMKNGDWEIVSTIDVIDGRRRQIHCVDGRKSDVLHISNLVVVDRNESQKMQFFDSDFNQPCLLKDGRPALIIQINSQVEPFDVAAQVYGEPVFRYIPWDKFTRVDGLIVEICE